MVDQNAEAIQKLTHALSLATRELATIVTMDENAPQASVAAGAVVRAKAELGEVAQLLGVEDKE